MQIDDVRAFALALPGVSEEDHHGRPSFRVAKKIFATLPDDGHVNIMLAPNDTVVALASGHAGVEALHWGKQLVGVSAAFGSVDPEPLRDLLETAWRRRAPKKLWPQVDR